MCCATYDPATRLLRWSRAGHPLPLFRDDEGRIELLQRMANPPIGISAENEFVERETRMEPGAAFVLYTDGLVERPDESIDVSMKRLDERLDGAGFEAGDIVALLENGSSGTEPETLSVLGLQSCSHATLCSGPRVTMREHSPDLPASGLRTEN